MRKKISTCAVIALSSLTMLSATPCVNINDANVKTFAEETTDSSETTTNSDKKEIELTADILNSAKQNKLYNNKVVFSFKAVKYANVYEVQCGSKKDIIKLTPAQLDSVNAGNVLLLTSTLKFAKGTLINDDIKIYPVIADENGKYEINENSKFITLKKENIKLIPVAPEKVSIPECYPTLKEINLSCDRTPYADGIQIKICNAKGKVIKTKKLKYKKATSKSVSLDVKKIDSKSFYKIKVRSYTTFNKKVVYGKWEVKYITNAVDTYATSDYRSGAIKISWDKVAGATGYTIYASTDGTKNFKKIKSVKKKVSSFSVKKLKRKALENGKHYFFYVTADKKVKKTVYSSPIRYSAEAVFIK